MGVISPASQVSCEKGISTWTNSGGTIDYLRHVNVTSGYK